MGVPRSGKFIDWLWERLASKLPFYALPDDRIGSNGDILSFDNHVRFDPESRHVRTMTKSLQCAMSSHSPHLAFLIDCIKMLAQGRRFIAA